MIQRIRKTAAIAAVVGLVAVGPASAFGNPNKAGGSGHFHPGSGPCVSTNDQPNCPGPH